MFWIFNLLILTHFNQTEIPATPADFHWKNRLIIIKGEGDCSEWFDEKMQKDLSDRKLLVFHFEEGVLVGSNFKGELRTVDFLKLFPERSDQNSYWVLVGLDGGRKSSGISVPKSSEIFRIVDAMPMRQSELLKKGNNDNSSKK